MNRETERKFLVRGDFPRDEGVRIVQGYLGSAPERTVRVRICGDKGFLTVKGIASESGMSRFEWEREISIADAESLLAIAEPGVIEKYRWLVPASDGHTFEVDEFHGDNEGLIVAEIELGSEDEAFARPAWLGDEVTGIDRYYNSMLAKEPYKSWR